ncbi:glutamine--fructose-6-phosphate transaminase (isomerizing) [Caproiciproducens sp. NJN-50]|uniref:glutamine--fructose-6-phosphate transaminase (isomerizing) n=1 Tax=Acutalibacteraceae TaxID=3082771 RepID=UPI000FFE1B03|nr:MULTISPECIES: glutamine--fructose-6-phosphate transaminase (isomerizing) [Acutalibacteraceae]QAT49706.1 glutamine--fructose-6-phosphate transaminase (isomerizing) [Caproiciproducens sp. NJN-50]
MCGIVGYAGGEQAAPILLQGLEKLEYKGYDSAGVAVYNGSSLEIAKARGNLKVLKEKTHYGTDVSGTVGIGHIRWATHGKPLDVNAHPQASGSEMFAVVHNGIIENYRVLKNRLTDIGFHFISDTDTEVAAQLLEFFYEGDILEAVFKTIQKIEGSYAFAVLCRDCPDRIIAFCKDSPLAVGIGKNENFIASDIPSILGKTRDVYRLEQEEVAIIKKDSVQIRSLDGNPIPKKTTHISWDIAAAEKSGYSHFMEKEIMEQPKAVRDTISPRIQNGKIVLDRMVLTQEQMKNIVRIQIIGCGSAYHAGVAAKYILEQFTRIPVEVDVASEFRYRHPIINQNVLTLVISQSGETSDTLAALREAKRHGSRVISIVNAIDSSVARESSDVIYTWAGPETAVAATKAYSTQLAVIYLLAIYLSDLLGFLSPKEYAYYISQLKILPDQIKEVLHGRNMVKKFAKKFYNCKDIFFIGRNLDYALSLEGAHKLKEIAYIHSEAYAAGELKHGTISLIEEGTLVVAPATQGRLTSKVISNIKEVKARGAVVLSLTSKNDLQFEKETDYQYYLPEICEMMMPSLAIVPLQMLAYDIASLRGCDIDRPRNLSKSVTVE